MNLTIAVLTYNGSALLEDCLKSIACQSDIEDAERVVVINGSVGEEVERERAVADKYGFRPDYIRPNRGNVGGQNACFEEAAGEKVLFVSNDVVLQPNCIAHLMNMPDLPDTGQIQPVIFTPSGAIDNYGMDYVWPGYGISRKHYVDDFTPIVPSICYLMRKSVWSKLGGFDESLPMAYEDVDMGLRLGKNGYLNSICTLASAMHKGNATLSYTHKDRWRFHISRQTVVKNNFTGYERFARLLAIRTIDGIRGIYERAKAPR